MKTVLFLLLTSLLGAAEWKAAMASGKITPEGPIWMSGYAARTRVSEGVLQDLYAKALALEDPKGRRVNITLTGVITMNANLDDVHEEDGLKKHPGLARKSGYIGFLGHHTRVGFRKIRIPPLVTR